jgi:hypothetical protein
MYITRMYCYLSARDKNHESIVAVAGHIAQMEGLSESKFEQTFADPTNYASLERYQTLAGQAGCQP